MKLECKVSKLKVSFTDYRDTKEEVGAEEERDTSVVIIQKNWPKMEALGTELNDAIKELSEIVATSEEGTEISDDPSTVIDSFKKEAKEAHKKYIELKDKHHKEIREVKKLQIKIENKDEEVVEVRREISRG